MRIDPDRPLLRIRRDLARARPEGADPQTVAGQLRVQFGSDYGALDLAKRLQCSTEDAQSLMDFWLPHGPPHLRDQALTAFARVLDVDLDHLRCLFSASDPSGVFAMTPPALGPSAIDHGRSAAKSAPRVPNIVWRKRRLATEPA